MHPYVSIFGHAVPTYGLLFAAGFLLSAFVGGIRVYKAGLKLENYIAICAFALILGVFGAMATYLVVTYGIVQLWEMVIHGDFSAFKNAGLVFYGGMLGGFAGAWIATLIVGDKLKNYLRPLSPCVLIGQGLGRIGCFCAGCCYGCPTDSALGVIYSHPVGGAPVGVRLLPIQLIEAGCDFFLFILLLLFSRKTKYEYRTFWMYLGGYGIVRFVMEFFRYDSIRGFAGWLSTSQWIAAAMLLTAVIGWAVEVRLSKRERLAEAAV